MNNNEKINNFSFQSLKNSNIRWKFDIKVSITNFQILNVERQLDALLHVQINEGRFCLLHFDIDDPKLLKYLTEFLDNFYLQTGNL